MVATRDTSPQLQQAWDKSNVPKLFQQKPDPSFASATGGFENNHVMVNHFRQEKGLHPLTRSARLDDLARKQAEYMAEHGEVVHSVKTKEQLGALLGSPVAGENVQRGPSIRIIHRLGLRQPGTRAMLLDEAFTKFGMGTGKGADGQLYMCQLFC